MPIPTGRQNPYAQEPAYGHHGAHHPQAMNGHGDRGQIPNGYPTGPGRQNGISQEGPSRGSNNNNHKSHYGVYGDPRHTAEMSRDPRHTAEQMGRDPRRPASYPNGHPPPEHDPSRRPVSYQQQPHPEPQPHPHGHHQSHPQQQPHPQQQAHPHPQQQAHQPSHHQPQPQQRGNRFPVEHLYTFAVDKKEGVVSVEDGIRKLRLLDAKGKIWSQDVRLMVTDKEVVLMDEYTQETLEVFPLQDIGAISAELKQCNYDSLLVITVRYSNKRIPEMMMFQCEQVPAPEIARSLQRAVDYFSSGKKKKQHRSENYGMVAGAQAHPQSDDRRMRYDGDTMYIPPPPDEPAPPPPIDGNVKNKVAAFAAAAAAAQANGNGISPRGFQSPKSAPVRSSESEEPIELLALRTERDVEILNHCFDDIEAFIGRLQKAAEAYTELSRRRQTRKNRRREHGDGLLLARSRPPTDGEYIECFQKFKYCFNLLAKLKAHIHDPNAPELVHFLLVPLKLIIQSCQGPELAASVVSPLLSPQAVDLLQNCLTSRQHELWMSLGRAWTLPSTEWPKDRPVSRYVPRFRDGWIPRPIPEPQTAPDFNTTVLVNNASVAASAAAVARESPRRLSDMSDQHDGPVFGHNHQRQPSNDSGGHIANGPIIHTNVPNGHSNGPSTRTNAPNGHSNGPIGHSHGPPIHTNGNGYHQRQSSDSLGHSPRGSAMPTPPPPAPKPVSSPAPPVSNPVPMRAGAKTATAIFDFVARNFKELTIMADEQLEVLNDTRKWWEVKNTSGQSGYVPSTLLKLTSPSPNTNTNSNHVPEPPHNLPPPPPPMSTFNAPPPPPPPPPSNGTGRSNSTQKANGMDFATQLQNTLRNKQFKQPNVQERAPASSSQYDTLQEELKNRVSNGGKSKNYRVPKRSISDVTLTYDSSRDDVKRWLESKGFSPMTVHSLGILNGAQLFSLTKEELQQVCHDDGSRVYSQLMIQKAALQEQQNGKSELDAIMMQRKSRVIDDALPPPDFIPVHPPVFDSPTGRHL